MTGSNVAQPPPYGGADYPAGASGHSGAAAPAGGSASLPGAEDGRLAPGGSSAY